MSISRGMDKEYIVCIYNGILLSRRKNKVIAFAAAWMVLEMIILGEASQRRISYNIAFMWNLKNMVQVNVFTRQTFKNLWLSKGKCDVREG